MNSKNDPPKVDIFLDVRSKGKTLKPAYKLINKSSSNPWWLNVDYVSGGTKDKN